MRVSPPQAVWAILYLLTYSVHNDVGKVAGVIVMEGGRVVYTITDYILTTFGYIQTTFWLHYDYLLTTELNRPQIYPS